MYSYYDDELTNEQIIGLALEQILENQMKIKEHFGVEKNDFYYDKKILEWLQKIN